MIANTDNNDSPQSIFLLGVRDSLSMAAAVGLFGFIFGLLAYVADVSFTNALAMSAFMFAGAAQMVSLSLWEPDHLPVLAMILTASVICLRFLLMSMTLQPLFKGLPPGKVYPSLLLLMDEIWALTLIKQRKTQLSNELIWAYYVGSGLTFYVFWLVCTIVGVKMGNTIHNPDQYGLDFAFTAVFLALLVGMRRGKQDIFPWAVSAIAAILAAHFLPGSWYIIIGALTGSVMGVLRDYH